MKTYSELLATGTTEAIAGVIVPTTESGVIDLTHAERIAEGGTHVLYRFLDAPMVVKVMHETPKSEELDLLEQQYTVLYACLYACFDQGGKQRCIREQHVIRQIMLPGKEPKTAALSIVPYEKCFESTVKFDFKIEPAEFDAYLMDHNPALFARINNALIHPSPTEPCADIVDQYAIMDARIGAILQRLDHDSELRILMSEFLNHYRNFYQQTNIILDAMGFENILFFKDDANAWQFKIGSVIKHDTGNYTNKLFSSIHAGDEVDLLAFFNRTHAYFSPANIRAVNVCAMKLNLAPVINDVIIDSTCLLTVSQRLSIPQKMLAYAQHGDFKKMAILLQEHIHQLTFNLNDSWAYPRIADEYIKHGQVIALKIYLDTVSKLPVVLPEKSANEKWVYNAQTAIVELKNMYDKKSTSGRHDPVRGISSSMSTQVAYPLATQNNMAPASAVYRAQGSATIAVFVAQERATLFQVEIVAKCLN